MKCDINSPDAGAEFVSFDQFSANARIEPLANHGRKGEVFFCGRSICFVDELGAAGLRQAHRGAVNNALFCNEEEAAVDSLRRRLPTVAALADYPEMQTRFPRAYARAMDAQQALQLI